MRLTKNARNLFSIRKEDIVGKHFTEVGDAQTKNLPELITAFSNVLAGKDVTFPICTLGEKQIFANARPIKISDKVIGIMVVTREES